MKDSHFNGEKSNYYLLLIDELDTLFDYRSEVAIHTTSKFTNLLLDLITGPESLRNFFIIGTAEHKDKLPSKLLQSKGFQLHLKLQLLTTLQEERFFKFTLLTYKKKGFLLMI